ncbi:PIG-L deacetylase family protein [Nocardioides xinjiangensis]|uniref:PIG-L deacetylase family protein n=1 Tax=Nocardioides xinjiangensis TaxID=2817376 RepID=UPI001B3108CE|nr:PIG-L family deacetylase [Nocardioides sp. SYSU D00514]
MDELTSSGPAGPRLQAVVAHPDDETFGCGGLLLHAAASGYTTFVTCATRGEAGRDRSGRSGAELGAVREEELRCAGELLGVAEVDLLGFADSGMVGPAPAGSLVGAELADVVDAIANSLRRVRPDVVVTLDASDGHRDHERVRVATLQAATEVGVDVVYLSCLSQSLMRRWVQHMRAHEQHRQHAREEMPVLGSPDHEISTVIDVHMHRAQLEIAMAAHASQDSPYDGLTDDLRDAFLDTARARRVVPAWDGTSRERDLCRGVPSTTAPAVGRTLDSLAVLASRRHPHGTQCWWNHLQARWDCTNATRFPS